MRHAGWVVGLVLLVAGVASAEPRATRRTASANGLYRVGLVEDAPGRCRLQVETNAGLHWVLPRCVGTVDDVYFVSRDGERVWVVHTLPPTGEGKPHKKRLGRRQVVVPGYAGVVVLEKFDRHGQRLQARRLSDVVKETAYERVRELAHHFRWLEGVGGVPGKGPRLNAAGAVELETVEGKTLVLPLG